MHDRFHITKLHFFMMCVDIVSDWSRYDPRSLIHGEQITVSLHTVMFLTVVLLIMVLEPNEMYSILEGFM